MTFHTGFSLHGARGERKYLNAQERASFYENTKHLSLERRLFCQMLYFTGARIGEISELSVGQVDSASRLVIIRTLKRRRNDIYRQIPLPNHIIDATLAMVEYKRKLGLIDCDSEKLWSFGSRTGSRLVKQVMQSADIDGIRASALGLRHGFAVHVVTRVPLTQVQKWMGHGHLSTTAIYLDVSGIEERQWAEKIWEEE